MFAMPAIGDVGLYCSADVICREEAIDLPHTHNKDPKRWEPVRIELQISTSAATTIGPVFSWSR
jgi:hypothetical protein